VSRDPSETIETFLIIIKIKLIKKIEIGIFCNFIKVFTLTFDQFNASLLNKSINYLQKNVYAPNFQIVVCFVFNNHYLII